MNVTIIQPPLVQLNTPYPSGAYLKAFFYAVKSNSSNCGVQSFSRAALIGNVRWLDLSNHLFHKIFSSAGLKTLFTLSENAALKIAAASDENTAFQIRRYISLQDAWCFWIDRIVEIACGGKSAREYTHEFVRSPYVPRGNRMETFLYNLGRDVTSDDAQILAGLALSDLSDYITTVFDSNFRLISYAEHLGTSEASFDNVIAGLQSPVLTEFYDGVLEEALSDGKFSEFNEFIRVKSNPSPMDENKSAPLELFLISVPFPGCFAAAVYTAKKIREMHSENAIIAIGGGFVNTELRNISEKRIFDYFDFISYDMGYGGYLNFLDKAGTAQCVCDTTKCTGNHTNCQNPTNSENRTNCQNHANSENQEKRKNHGKTTPEIDLSTVFDEEKSPKFDFSAVFDGEKLYKIKYRYNGEIVGDCDSANIPKCTGGKNTLNASEYAAAEIAISKTLVPDYSDIDFSKYPRLADDTNPMHRIWNDGSWLKAYLAHGCYWHRCTFCDTTLEYVNRFSMCDCRALCDGLTKQAEKTGVWGIHFVDEACPPAALLKFGLQNCRNSVADKANDLNAADTENKRDMSAKVNFANKADNRAIGKKLTYWGNIRFEKTFTRDLANFLSYSGLIAVSAGIEIATGEGLASVNKGTTIENIVKACCAFKEAGILVHAYMIFGFYNQSEQDLINSMETLRQFFKNGLLDSAFWHKFTLTRHSTVYKEWLEGKHPNLHPIDIPKNADGLITREAEIPNAGRRTAKETGMPNAGRRIFEKFGMPNAEKFLNDDFQNAEVQPQKGKIESPVGNQNAEKIRFAENDLRFEGEEKSEKYSAPLNAALDSWMHGENLDVPVTNWFEYKMPAPTISRKYIKKMINAYERERDSLYKTKPSEKDTFVWIGGKVLVCGKEHWNCRENRNDCEANKKTKIRWQFMGEEHECECEKAAYLADVLNGLKPEHLIEEILVKKRKLLKLCDEKTFEILRSSGLCRI